jgi:glycosyltransferase involved in cell wall biosynthesis
VTLRAGVDAAPLLLTRAGTARYVEGLASALDRRADVEVERLTWGGPSRITAAVRDVAWYPALLPLSARSLDVLHCTTFRAPPRAPVPVIATAHDLAVLRFPEYFTAWTRLYGRTFLRRVLRAVDAVIAVSEFTKRDVIELAGVPDGRVHVVPNATSEAFAPHGARAGGEYVLAVGTLEPRKNLRRLADAAGRLDVELRVVGATGWGGVEVEGDGVRWLGRLPDDALAEQYRGALCVAYPSLYEGFGIPVLEAMRCGTAVVTSAGSAMEEVAGGAAELVDPTDVASIADGIERAIARREELRALGLDRAKRFTWDAAAEQTVAVYRRVADEP